MGERVGEPDRPLRLLLVLGRSGGGIGRHVAGLAADLAAVGHRVLVAGPADTAETFGLRTGQVGFVPVEIADRPRPPADARAALTLRRLAARADAVHAHGVRAGALAVLAARARRSRPTVLVTVHNAPPEGGAARVVFTGLERLVARGADAVLAVSADLEARARAAGARRVARAVVPAPAAGPGGADVALTRRRLGLRPDEPVVLVLARLGEQKGLPLLLDTAALLRGGDPAPTVLVAGDGPLRATLQRRIDAEGLPVRLLGRRDDVPDLLAAADLVLSTSRWEGQPLGLQEALRAGRPVVATDVGGVADVLGGAGRLVPYGDPAALAAAVRRSLEPAEHARLAAASARRAGELPDQAAATAQALAGYRGLL